MLCAGNWTQDILRTYSASELNSQPHGNAVFDIFGSQYACTVCFQLSSLKRLCFVTSRSGEDLESPLILLLSLLLGRQDGAEYVLFIPSSHGIPRIGGLCAPALPTVLMTPRAGACPYPTPDLSDDGHKLFLGTYTCKLPFPICLENGRLLTLR